MYIDCQSPENRRHKANVTQLRVIAAALGQTGSSSIMDALRELGLRSYHADDFSTIAKPVMFDGIDPIRWAKVASTCRMEAISLEPITDLLPLVLSVSPKAKVVLSWRDFPSWQKSTLTGGITKDMRLRVVKSHAISSKSVFPWIELWDSLTSDFLHARLDGRPIRQPISFISYLYKELCSGYSWPINDVFSRGTYKVNGHEEAYLAHLNEVRVVTPPDRLFEVDVKTMTFGDLEKILGLPTVFGDRRLPQTRKRTSRTNDPLLDGMSSAVVRAHLLLVTMHSLNYFVLSWAVKAIMLLCSLAAGAVSTS